MRICVTDCDHADMKQEEAVFEKAGVSYTLFQCRTEDDLIQTCAGYDIAINQYAPFTERVLRELSPTLKQIVRYGVGVDNVDVEAATKYGVQVCNVPDYGMNEVADQAVALTLAVWRKVNFIGADTKKGNWDYTRAIPIRRIPGSTVGIVGLGRIGLTYAKRMSGFDVKLIGCDPFREEGTEIEGVSVVSFEEVIERADSITIHVPLDETTRNLFRAETFRKMKNNAILVNTSRGGIINELDLCEALKNGEIAGAGLDVIEREPIAKDHPLLSAENCILTPHIAWYSEEAAAELKRKVAEEALRFLRGEPVAYPVNRPAKQA